MNKTIDVSMIQSLFHSLVISYISILTGTWANIQRVHFSICCYSQWLCFFSSCPTPHKTMEPSGMEFNMMGGSVHRSEVGNQKHCINAFHPLWIQSIDIDIHANTKEEPNNKGRFNTNQSIGKYSVRLYS